MLDLPKNKQIIMFDGVCNLCNSSVLKVIKHDKDNRFMFTSLSSEKGKEIVKYLKIDTLNIDSIILYQPGEAYYIKSTAALKIMETFGGLWFLSKIFYIIPDTIRDLVYEFIAKNRYKWFGKTDNCMIPTPELKNKFIE